MRFMMLMIPKSYGELTPENVEPMMQYNASLTKAGILLAVDGLHDLSDGARVTFPGGKATVTDGPFAEAKELLGGYWIIDVKSKAEAVEWATRCPANEGDIIEVRQVQAMEDFSPELRAVIDRPR